MAQKKGERLQKALAHLGHGSRRDVEEWIRAGRLTVNGSMAELGTRVQPSDHIRLDGRPLHWRPIASAQVLVCHRSPGEPLAGRSTAERPALITRLPRSAGRRFVVVSPMPVRDGGLELVTSDGALAEKLQRGVRRLRAEYSVRLRGELGEPQLRRVLTGEIDPRTHMEVTACVPAGGEGANRWYSLEVCGASGRQVRLLFEHAGVSVSRVLRTRLGPLVLDRALARGRFRRLTPEEIAALREVEAPAATARRISRR